MIAAHMKTIKNAMKKRNTTIPITTWLHALILIAMVGVTGIILFGEILLLPSDELDWCHSAQQHKRRLESKQRGPPNILNPMNHHRYENPDYDSNPCHNERPSQFLYLLSPQECDYARRLIASVVLAAVLGWEQCHRRVTTTANPTSTATRKRSHKTLVDGAGLRTMCLVSLGSCCFTLCSMMAFRSTSTMGWDASRVSAAIPSGVGFLGAGLIWKVSLKLTIL